jgi:hypothetical protein
MPLGSDVLEFLKIKHEVATQSFQIKEKPVKNLISNSNFCQ